MGGVVGVCVVVYVVVGFVVLVYYYYYDVLLMVFQGVEVSYVVQCIGYGQELCLVEVQFVQIVVGMFVVVGQQCGFQCVQFGVEVCQCEQGVSYYIVVCVGICWLCGIVFQVVLILFSSFSDLCRVFGLLCRLVLVSCCIMQLYSVDRLVVILLLVLWLSELLRWLMIVQILLIVLFLWVWLLFFRQVWVSCMCFSVLVSSSVISLCGLVLLIVFCMLIWWYCLVN